MKQYLLSAIAYILFTTAALAQCNGIFPNNTVCGNITGANNTPRPTNPSAFLGAAGGTNGQIQYNNGGALGGFTMSGDCTTNTSTGVITCSALSGSTPNVQTIDYTIATSDCWKVVQVGTGSTGLKTITLPSVSGFTAGCQVIVCNGDTGRGKKTSGFPSDVWGILWPSKCMLMGVVNSAWKTINNQGRWYLPSDKEICVRQDGSNTSDGLGNGTVAADCMATQQNAVVTIGTQWDGTGYHACNIGLYAGGTSTFNEQVSMTGQSIGCYLTFNFRGAVTVTSSVNCYTGGDNGIAIWNMNLGFTPIFQCNTSNTATNAVWYCHQTCIYDVFGTFEWIPGGNLDSLLFVDGQGRVTMDFSGGGLIIGDGNPRTFLTMFNCDEHCSQIQTSGTTGCSAGLSSTAGSSIYKSQGGSLINAAASSWAGCGTIAATGYAATGNSVIITNGVTLPVTTQNSSGTGGQISATKI